MIPVKKPGLCVLALVLTICLAMLPDASIAETSDEVKELRNKVEELEKKQSMLYHSLEEKKAAGLMKSITDRLNLGGLIELEASRDENKKTGDASDVTLATVQLGLDAEINERLTGHILLLWEEDSTDPINVDEGTLTYKALGNVTLVGGKTYIPFGVF